ncbi:TPA: capsular biosynthesis protein, partial [Kluyvera ascorbata]|nr:capsular biosynthesis protein [Kluyvera ascorbata]
DISAGADENSQKPLRFRDMGMFRYWFRSVEKYAPWVRKIHLVTCGQVPEWLNVDHDKINIVKHSDIMDEACLPTFSSRAIEVNIYKIKGLSEKFVFFNDDMMLNSKVDPEFYFKNDLPNDFMIDSRLNPTSIDNIVFNSTIISNTSVINTFFNRRLVIKNNKRKYYSYKYGRYLIKNIQLKPHKSFDGFLGKHLPQPFLKSTFEEIWGLKEVAGLLNRTSRFKFREGCCLNQYLFRYWQLVKGHFNPCNPKEIGACYHLSGDEKQLLNAIADLKSDKPQICLNDSFSDDDTFHHACEKLAKTLNMKLGTRSSFELAAMPSTDAAA